MTTPSTPASPPDPGAETGVLPARLGLLAALVVFDVRWWHGAMPPVIDLSLGLLLVLLAWQMPGLTGVAITWVVSVPMVLAGWELANGGTGAASLFLAGLLQAGVSLALVVLGWKAYRRARGTSTLDDPTSAILFLLIFVTGTALAAGLHAVLQGALLPRSLDWLTTALGFGLNTALGIFVLAVPLLVLYPPALTRRVTPVRAEPAEGDAVPDTLPPNALEADVLMLGDWLETGGLALASGLLALVLLLADTHSTGNLLVWGVTLLPIIWASLRQRLHGATLAAACAALLPLAVLGIGRSGVPLWELQGGLLTQCLVALLIGAAFAWIRFAEDRYQQVVGRVPVVLYSARIVEMPTGHKGNGRGEAGLRVPRAEVTLVGAASVPLLGCSPQSLLGDHSRWLALIHPADREVIQAALVQLTMQKQPVVCEYRLLPDDEDVLKTPTKPPRWLRDTLAPRFNRQGRLVGWDGVITDISEQRILADDLRRTSSMFHVLVTNLPAGIFFVQGTTGRPILVNARARQLLGQREDSAAGLEHLSQVYRLYREDGSSYPVQDLPVYQALKYGRATMRDDIVVHRPDGRRTPLISWAAPLRLSGHGKDDAAVWVLEDLTAVHQAEKARRETEGRLRAVIETMSEGLIVLDRQGKIVESNTAAVQLLKVPGGSLVGWTLSNLPMPLLEENGRPLTATTDPVAAVLRTGQPLRNLVLGFTAAGEARELGGSAEIVLGPQRWMLLNALPLGSVNALQGVVVTLTDITTSRRAQEILRSSEQRYRGLVEALPLMLVQFDTALRVEYINSATTRISGYSMDQIRDPAIWMQLILPEDLSTVQDALKRSLAGEVVRYEFRYRTADGNTKVGFSMVQPYRHEEQILGLLCLIVDVTRERQLERELQRSQRLELIGRLSSGVAHDFNNLLTVVLNLSAVSARDLPTDHPVRDNLNRITEAGEVAAALASQLLAFSRQQKIAIHSLDLNQIARRTFDLVRPLLPGSITATLTLTDEPLVCRADATQVQQVLLNLCLNARDAMPGGGQLAVSTARLTTENGSESWARLVVEDSGLGMSEDVRRSIFEPFFTTREAGTGLGLFVVQHIVESYGARIEVTSEPGRGTRFEVLWPLENPSGSGR